MNAAIAELVAAGVAFMDENDPQWWRADVERAIDLDTLDLQKTDLCILGQRCPLETLAEEIGVDAGELGPLDFGEAYYVNAHRLTGFHMSRQELAEWAASLGFNALDGNYGPLAAEWKRVITERRSAS